ncbi:MAG TPA: hypothetical protein VJT72_09550 [Pseudonocardiaceae bacterium]|nr:hypothetical protein [Pseudonocardiaceae bacterium]
MAAPGHRLPLRVRGEVGGHQAAVGLAADYAERQALLGVAEDCPNTTIVYEPPCDGHGERTGPAPGQSSAPGGWQAGQVLVLHSVDVEMVMSLRGWKLCLILTCQDEGNASGSGMDYGTSSDR